jgi:hypothetical protein
MSQPPKPAIPQRLCFIVDGTAAMANYFPDIRKEVLDLLISYLHRASQHINLVEVAVVVYRSRDSFSEAMVQSSTWQPWGHRSNENGARFVDTLFNSTHFSGGGSSETALADALAQALYLNTCPVNPDILDSIPGLSPDSRPATHFFLITATLPSRLPAPAIKPPPQGGTALMSHKDLLRSIRLHGASLSTITTRDNGSMQQSLKHLFLYAHGSMELPDEQAQEKLRSEVDKNYKCVADRRLGGCCGQCCCCQCPGCGSCWSAACWSAAWRTLCQAELPMPSWMHSLHV